MDDAEVLDRIERRLEASVKRAEDAFYGFDREMCRADLAAFRALKADAARLEAIERRQIEVWTIDAGWRASPRAGDAVDGPTLRAAIDAVMAGEGGGG